MIKQFIGSFPCIFIQFKTFILLVVKHSCSNYENESRNGRHHAPITSNRQDITNDGRVKSLHASAINLKICSLNTMDMKRKYFNKTLIHHHTVLKTKGHNKIHNIMVESYHPKWYFIALSKQRFMSSGCMLILHKTLSKDTTSPSTLHILFCRR